MYMLSLYLVTFIASETGIHLEGVAVQIELKLQTGGRDREGETDAVTKTNESKAEHCHNKHCCISSAVQQSPH